MIYKQEIYVSICLKIKKILKLLFYYSGSLAIWHKINPPAKNKPATFPLWVIGIYVAFFGVASQRYENRVDIIENRTNAIFTQLSTPAYKKAISRIPTVQKMSCPEKPEILKPYSVMRSLFSDTTYPAIVNLLKETVEDWKDSLDSVNLRGANLQKVGLLGANLQEAVLCGANLQKADLWVANLQEADLQGANLRETKMLSVGQLCHAFTLYKTKLDPELEKQIKKECPDLLETPRHPHWSVR